MEKENDHYHSILSGKEYINTLFEGIISKLWLHDVYGVKEGEGLNCLRAQRFRHAHHETKDRLPGLGYRGRGEEETHCRYIYHTYQTDASAISTRVLHRPVIGGLATDGF